MMLIEAKLVVCGLLLAGTALIGSATEHSKPVGIEEKSAEVKPDGAGLCDTDKTFQDSAQRSCSKLEYYDKLKQKCRDFPGGGILVIMDHSTKCAHGDSGLHTFSRRDYYYVCHPEGVMIGLCPDNTVFSDTEKRCILQTNNVPSTIKVHDESRNCNIMVPDCNGVGLFPIPANCSFYFKCQEHNYNFYQYVYQCPPGKVFHPDLLRCSSSNKCYDGHEDILNSFNKDYFPECHIYGQFRTAKDCTLYYRCVPNMDGSFYQIRYECPYKMYYSIEKEICMPEIFHSCDYIPHERIIADYKLQHSLEASTVGASPTTVICAINTKITSTIPTYADTTQPMDVTGAKPLDQESGESYSTPMQVTYATEEPLIPFYDYYPTEQNQTTYQEYEDTEMTGDEPLYYDYYPTEPTQITYQEYEDTTDSNAGNESLEERYNTDMVAMNQNSHITEKEVGYEDDAEINDAHESATLDESRRIYGEDNPTESTRATTRWINAPLEEPTEYLSPPEVEVGDQPVYNSTRPRFEFDYDGMEWDSGAWVVPNRTRTGPQDPSNDRNGTETPSLSGSTEWPDHYLVDSPATTNSYSGPEVSCEYLAYTTEDTAADDSYISPAVNYSETANSIESTSTSFYENVNVPAVKQPCADPSATRNAIHVSCIADEDGELVCNGQKLSIKGQLEMLGYALKLTKWAETPIESSVEPGPPINIHLSLQHPFNYVLEAYSTKYRTSSSYDELITTTMKPTDKEVAYGIDMGSA